MPSDAEEAGFVVRTMRAMGVLSDLSNADLRRRSSLKAPKEPQQQAAPTSMAVTFADDQDQHQRQEPEMQGQQRPVPRARGVHSSPGVGTGVTPHRLNAMALIDEMYSRRAPPASPEATLSGGGSARSSDAASASPAALFADGIDDDDDDEADAFDDAVDDTKVDDTKVDDAKVDDAKVDDAKVDDAEVDDTKADDDDDDDGAANQAVKEESGQADRADADDGRRGRDPTHPIFGELLADLGFKRVYRASARALVAHVPIWHRNRPPCPLRVADIVAAKLKQLGPQLEQQHDLESRPEEQKTKPLVVPFQGSIQVFDVEHLVGPSLDEPQKLGVFDGQHRLLAAQDLLSLVAPRDLLLTVEVYPVLGGAQVVELFTEVNKAEMVQHIDLPDAVPRRVKLVVDQAAAACRAQWPAMFGNERCQRPNMHLPRLRTRLVAAVEALGIDSAEDLLARVEAVNAALGQRPASAWPPAWRRNLAKCRREGCWLGLHKDFAWIEDDLIQSSDH